MICPAEHELARALSLGADDALTAHLAECARCRDAWDGLSRAIRLARELPAEIPSSAHREEARTALLASVDAGTPRRVQRVSRLVWIAGGVAAAAIAALWLSRGMAGDVRSHASLHPSTGASFAVASGPPDEIVRLHDGVLAIDVDALGPDDRFRIVVGDDEVEVRGTSFEVTAHDDHLVGVRVAHGRVEVRPRVGVPTSVGAGESWHGVRTATVESAGSSGSQIVSSDSPTASSDSPTASSDSPTASSDSPTASSDSSTASSGAQTTSSGAQTTSPGAQTTSSGAQTTARDGAQTRARDGAQTTSPGAQTTSSGAQTRARDGAQTTSPSARTTARDGAQTTSSGARTTSSGAQTTARDGATSSRQTSTSHDATTSRAATSRAASSHAATSQRLSSAAPHVESSSPTVADRRDIAKPISAEETAYNDAWDALRTNDFRKAAAGFARVVALSPAGPLADDAAYWHAVSLARAARGSEAITAFRALLDDYPSSPRTGEASAMLGWLLVDANQPVEAERRFRAAANDVSESVRASARSGLDALAAKRSK